ncbi:MAG TPA: hypothetical protein VIK61_06575 [Acidimicrobiia bacterium]
MVAARVTVVAATADGGSRAGPSVRLAAGDRASGLACMLASLLHDNLRDFRTRSLVARITRGDVVLLASDRDIAVTLSFRPGEILIEDGAVPGAPVLAGEWLDMAKLCSGQRSAIAAVGSGELRVTPGRGMLAAAGAGLALSVPKSFYEENRESLVRRRGVVVASVLLATVALAALVAWRSRRSVAM